MPNATLCAGYRDWQMKFNRQVNRGEHGITIFAPSTKVYEKKTGELDENGNEIIKKTKIMRFYPVTVFDVSQTEGAELPDPIRKLSNDVNDYEKLIEVLKSLAPGDVIFEDIEKGANGYFSNFDNSIHVQKDMSPAQTIKTLIHELAHSRIHNSEAVKDREVSRDLKEVEAESIAFIICDHIGVDSSDYSFGYVSMWSKGKTLEELKETADVIKKSSMKLIEELDDKLEAISEKISLKELENKVKAGAQDILNEAALPGNILDVVAYAETDNKMSDVNKANILIFSGQEDRMNLVVQGDKNKILDCLKDASDQDKYFDSMSILSTLKKNGYSYTQGSINSRNVVYDIGYDNLTNTLYSYTEPLTEKSIKVIACIESKEKEDALFNALNDAKLQYDGATVEINTVISEGRESWNESYIERLDRYDMAGAEPRPPVVEVLFSNFNNPLSDNYMNTMEAAEYFDKLKTKFKDPTDKVVTIKISYVRYDWSYESIHNINLGTTKDNFIDSLHMPQSVISYLKAHNSILEMSDMAHNFSPGTDYGSNYADRVDKWSKYCCMELNHNSDNPVIPRPPEINDYYMVLNNEWSLGR